ncbi:MAG: bifunctional riboflavin kinase/FAD synthetase [Actinomycetota bacterium]|nr:bifunctional riboflavin kinase/FAD synthetase [Actinomycetota bacterium]
MEIRRDLRPAEPQHKGTAVTIGAYDGVHLGHRQVISELCRLAHQRGLVSAVVTFDRHPASVVRPDSAPLLLTDLDQKLEQLATTGVDLTQVVTFDQERADEDAEIFVSDVLVGCLGAQLIAVGEDFHFGHQRQGNVELLRRIGADLGFEVHALGLVGPDGATARDHEQVSSTFIRDALARGDLDRANAMLGRLYEVRGAVEHGDGRGRELGFPTANVRVDPSVLLPADGVYAGFYQRPDATVYPAAISLGSRPHFYNDGGLLLEAYLLDAGCELYGETASVRFTEFIRGQQRFDSLDELVAQLQQDVEVTRGVTA